MADHLEGRIASYVIEHRVRHRSGEWKWFAMRGKVLLRDEQGRPLRMMGTMIDISERKQADIERLEHEATLAKFKAILDQTLVSVFMFHHATLRFTYSNRSACKHAGYSENELLRMTPADINPLFTLERFQAMVQPLLNGSQSSLSFKSLHRHKNGNDIQVAVSAGHVGIFEHDHQSDTLYWSPIVREIFGVSPDEPASLQYYLRLIPESDRESVLSAVQQAHDPTGTGNFTSSTKLSDPMERFDT